MSNKSDKAKQADLKARSDALSKESTADRAAVREPSELDKAQSDEALNWLKLLKDPNRDFSKSPMPFDVTAEDGAAGAEEERTALGAMRFGAASADPNLQAVLKSNVQERRAQRRGLALNDAVARYDQMMRALGGDVAARDQARRMGVAGMTTGASGQATSDYSQFQVRPHWGLTLAASGIGAAGTAAGGYLGKP